MEDAPPPKRHGRKPGRVEWSKDDELLLVRFYIHEGPNWLKFHKRGLLPDRSRHALWSHWSVLRNRFPILETILYTPGWTESLDKKLFDFVEDQPTDSIDWDYIAAAMKKKKLTPEMCKERFNQIEENSSIYDEVLRAVRNFKPRPFWTEDDEQKLVSLYQHFGPEWTIISNQFEDKSENSVRQRFSKLLKEDKIKININSNERRIKHWTSKEDSIILKKVSELGEKWESIAPYLKDREPLSIQQRYNQLVYQKKDLKKKSKESTQKRATRKKLNTKSKKTTRGKHQKSNETGSNGADDQQDEEEYFENIPLISLRQKGNERYADRMQDTAERLHKM